MFQGQPHPNSSTPQHLAFGFHAGLHTQKPNKIRTHYAIASITNSCRTQGQTYSFRASPKASQHMRWHLRAIARHPSFSDARRVQMRQTNKSKLLPRILQQAVVRPWNGQCQGLACARATRRLLCSVCTSMRQIMEHKQVRMHIWYTFVVVGLPPTSLVKLVLVLQKGY